MNAYPYISAARFSIQILVSVLGIMIFVSQAEAAEELNCQWILNETAEQNPKEKYKKGYCSIELGRFQEGVRLLTGIEHELPLIGDYALYYQGVGEKGLGNLGRAEEIFNALVNRYPDSAVRKKAFEQLAEICAGKGDYEKAEKSFKSLYYEANDPLARAKFLNSVAESQEKQGKPGEAMRSYKELWVEFPESGFADAAFNKASQMSISAGVPLGARESDYRRRAERLFRLYKWGAALRNFESVTQTTEVRTKIAVSKFRLGRLDEASAILAQISSPESLYWTAKITAKRDRDEEAAQIYHQISQLYPQSALAAEGLYNGGRLYQLSSNLEKAVEMYDLLVRNYPESEFAEDAAWNLGWTYYKRGRYREALATFSAFTASKSHFNSSRSAYWKAKILEKQGKGAEAYAEYESLARSPHISYYSYLAKKKTGLALSLSTSGGSTKTTVNAPGSGKVELLIELGALDDAALEINRLRRRATGNQELLYISTLYAKANDFDSSIKVAQEIGLPEGNELSYPKGFSEIVRGLVAKYGVDEYIVYSIIREESRFQKRAVSPADAIGLMQLIPSTGRSTAREVGIAGYYTDMLYTPRINIELGIAYFSMVLREFNGNVHLALASYNAGPHNVTKWIGKFPGLDTDEFVEEIPYLETRNYVKRVLRSYGAYKAIYDGGYF